MTLCVAWRWVDRHGDQIFFAADTCVTLGPNEMEFGGVKISEIPVIYSGPRDSVTGHQEKHEFRYGMAFSGEYLAASLVRELISQLLANLQGIGGASTVSFDNVCELVGKVHQRLHKEIKEKLLFGEKVEFFLGGFCPAAQRVRVAKFYVEADGDRVARTEILTRAHGESYEVLGSSDAKTRFLKLLKLNLDSPPCRVHFVMFRRLRDIIMDPAIRGVAGAIQCGEFAPHQRDFRLIGAGMVVAGRRQPELRKFLGGIDVEKLHEPDPSGLHIHHVVALPFNADIGNFSVVETFRTCAGTTISLDELITVLPYDSHWAERFEEMKVAIRGVLGRKVTIEHIGSTAVPGLAAVPVIDILITAEPVSETDGVALALGRIGYEFIGADRGELRPLFRSRSHYVGSNLYFAPPGSDFETRAVQLRTLLRLRNDLRKEYETKKLEVLNQDVWTLYGYNALKEAKLRELLGFAAKLPRPVRTKWWHRLLRHSPVSPQ